jgi:exodeoxyribonuclease V beta subunit
MADHGYHLQYLLYTIALDRYLTLRLPGYRYETQFGGVLYLFVRGVRPAWSATGSDIPGDGTPVPAACGVFFHRPKHDMLRALDDLLGAPRPKGVTG